MATRIRLRRTGRKKLPIYRIVVADKEAPRDGRFIEIIGTYQPKLEGATVGNRVAVIYSPISLNVGWRLHPGPIRSPRLPGLRCAGRSRCLQWFQGSAGAVAVGAIEPRRDASFPERHAIVPAAAAD